MAEKKNKIELGLKNEPDTMKVITNKVQKEVKGLFQLDEKIVDKGTLISNLNYPVIVKYGTDHIRVSPRARLVIADRNKLGNLPKGIILI